MQKALANESWHAWIVILKDAAATAIQSIVVDTTVPNNVSVDAGNKADK